MASVKANRGPGVSIITSCSVRNNLEVVQKLLSRGERSVDLYLFPDEDLRAHARFAGREVAISDFLDDESISDEDFAKLAADSLLPAPEPGNPETQYTVVAGATNIPGICDSEETSRKRAVRQIVRCARLIHHMNGTCLEVVGGLGLEKRGDAVIRAGKDVEKQRRASLIRSLAEIDDQLREVPVGIALEIEPGLPFLVRNLETARRVLCDPDIIGRDRIGLNVDIGHLLLLHDQYKLDDMAASRLLINEIKEEKTSTLDDVACTGSLLPKVMHFHASDHSAGHFCDLKIASYHKPRVFHRYVGLFLDIMEARERNKYFTGHISVEQEACHNLDQVLHSAQLLRNWIRSYKSPLGARTMGFSA